MKLGTYDPITYSDEITEEDNPLGYAIFGLFAILSLGSVLGGIYIVVVDPELWGLFIFALFIAAVLGFVAMMFFPSNREVIYSYELNESGLHQYWKNRKTEKRYEHHILYKDIDRILVGIFLSHRSGGGDSVGYTVVEAQLIIIASDTNFYQRFYLADDLQEWIIRFQDKNVPIHYTDYDLSRAMAARQYIRVDFSQLEGSPYDIVSHHINNDFTGPFTSWMPEGAEEEIVKKINDTSRRKTKRAEKRTLQTLFVVALLFGLFILPQQPLAADGFIEYTDFILLGYHGINFLIPLILVFWRRYQKWYNSLLYCVIVIIGNSIGLFITDIFIDLPNLYKSVLLMNITLNLIMWYAALLVAKILIFIGEITPGNSRTDFIGNSRVKP